MTTQKTITVVAIAQGFDNLVVRNVGEVFEMPEDVFAQRPKKDANGKIIPGEFHEPPSWFEPLDEGARKRVEKQRSEHPLLSIDPANQAAAHEIANQRLADEEARVAQQAREAREQKARDAKK